MPYQITFNQITCLMPSSGSNTRSEQAAKAALDTAAKILGAGSKIAGLAGPDGKVVGAVLEIIGSLASVGSSIAGLVEWIDKARRESGKDPDNFYITYSLLQDAEGGAYCLYPARGVFQGSQRTKEQVVDLAKGVSAPNLPATFGGLIEGPPLPQGIPFPLFVCFWDHDNDSSDDLLVSIPINDQNVGSFQKTFYNSLQDCAYYVDWKLEKVLPGLSERRFTGHSPRRARAMIAAWVAAFAR